MLHTFYIRKTFDIYLVDGILNFVNINGKEIVDGEGNTVVIKNKKYEDG